ncbi:MAG: biotin/lipoyl-containing protein [Fervidicoccaceae archaeon]
MSEYKVKVDGKEYTVRILGERGNTVEVDVEGIKLSVSLEEAIATKRAEAAQVAPKTEPQIEASQKPVQAAPAPVQPAVVTQPSPAGAGVVTSKVPGKVKEIKVAEGQQVQAGQAVVVVESMKMDIEIRTNRSGTVKAVYVKPGQFVQKDAPLILVE